MKVCAPFSLALWVTCLCLQHFILLLLPLVDANGVVDNGLATTFVQVPFCHLSVVLATARRCCLCHGSAQHCMSLWSCSLSVFVINVVQTFTLPQCSCVICGLLSLTLALCMFLWLCSLQTAVMSVATTLTLPQCSCTICGVPLLTLALCTSLRLCSLPIAVINVVSNDILAFVAVVVGQCIFGLLSSVNNACTGNKKGLLQFVALLLALLCCQRQEHAVCSICLVSLMALSTAMVCFLRQCCSLSMAVFSNVVNSILCSCDRCRRLTLTLLSALLPLAMICVRFQWHFSAVAVVICWHIPLWCFLLAEMVCAFWRQWECFHWSITIALNSWKRFLDDCWSACFVLFCFVFWNLHSHLARKSRICEWFWAQCPFDSSAGSFCLRTLIYKAL